MFDRYEVIAGWINTPFEIGDVLDCSEERQSYLGAANAHYAMASELDKYPHLFRKLEWWEKRSLDDLVAVKYVKITSYVGYWKVGDIVMVDDYIFNKGVLTHYQLEYDKKQTPSTVIPVTEATYKAFKR